ncbi:5-oxoprolinase subunit B family protein [Nonlabens ulvanivorans]|uniref:KipI family sensor histidine kinase inhibitor n=1 Tax=Nonlabens ulvanivorans TaxID=906888 RepID=A0ABX5E746_NONUL|nr:carboxyltransferase domain-containing protein [Nonlabens ulvanivorans]PRX14160.1 KipI family sensor histidine kinase inhibitor [Nonlabens ulvanivorans]
MDSFILYHQYNENSLLVTIDVDTNVQEYRSYITRLINDQYRHRVVLNQGFNSVLILWREESVTRTLIDEVKLLLKGITPSPVRVINKWKLPVYYDCLSADIRALSKYTDLEVGEIIRLHQQAVYTVSFMGFLPGFPYLNGLPESLSIPRKVTPSLQVKTGSVAIAAGICGIYPQSSPGGWYVLGNCPVPLFNREREQAFLLSINDQVEFYEVDKSTFTDLKQKTSHLDINQFKNG